MASFPSGIKKGMLNQQNNLVCLALIFFINFLANFLLFKDFGFYEDDYLMTIPPMTWSFIQYKNHIIDTLMNWPQGRPIFWFLQHTISFTIAKIGSVSAYHLFSYVLTSAAGCTVFILLAKLYTRPVALLAAGFFVLFPADTSKQIFMHQIHVPLTTILVVTALFLSIKGKWTVVYILSLCVLLTYEPYFLLFFFAPLLTKARDFRHQYMRMIANAIPLIIILAGTLWLRRFLGEHRASDVLGSLDKYLPKALSAPWIGGWTAVSLCVTRAVEALLHSSLWQWVFIMGTIGIVLCFTCYINKHNNEREINLSNVSDPYKYWRLFVMGLGMFLASYLYRFYPDYYPPIVNIGRRSLLHAAGSIGLCFAVASLISLVVNLSQKSKMFVYFAMSCYIGLLVSSGIEIQATQYVRNWQQQKVYYSAIIDQISDLRDGDLIVVNIESAYKDGIESVSPSDGFSPYYMVDYPLDMMPRLLHIPVVWKKPPRIIGYYERLTKKLIPSGLVVKMPGWYPDSDSLVIADKHFLFFEFKEGKLTRSSNPIAFQGKEFRPRNTENVTTSPFPKTSLHEILFRPDIEKLWPTIYRSINYPR
jgi:hypothetical protein